MRRPLRLALAAVLLGALAAAGCTSKPRGEAELPRLAFAAEPNADLTRPDILLDFPSGRGGLAGRTIRVGGLDDLVLARKEVVLTFDDGPVRGKTPAILDALDRHGVRATFLMVGQMARSYPDLVREVARRGHTIGTHTQSHPDLSGMAFDAAVAEIERGRASVDAALVPSGRKAAPFFRFPYLADTARLRRHLAMRGVVVVHPSVDSKDYFVSTPDQVRARTLAALERAGSGIVLFHDLHARTVAMLPDFLDDLAARGYRVVHLVPRSPAGGALVSAALSAGE